MDRKTALPLMVAAALATPAVLVYVVFFSGPEDRGDDPGFEAASLGEAPEEGAKVGEVGEKGASKDNATGASAKAKETKSPGASTGSRDGGPAVVDANTGGSSTGSGAGAERAEKAKALAAAADVANASDDSGGARGTVAREDVQEAVREVVPRMGECYEDMLAEFPDADADGKIIVSFDLKVIEGIAEMDVVKIGEGSTLYETRMHECVKESLRDVTFPADGAEDAKVSVNYPFVFSKRREATRQ